MQHTDSNCYFNAELKLLNCHKVASRYWEIWGLWKGSWQTWKGLASVFSWIIVTTETRVAYCEGFSTLNPQTGLCPALLVVHSSCRSSSSFFLICHCLYCRIGVCADATSKTVIQAVAAVLTVVDGSSGWAPASAGSLVDEGWSSLVDEGLTAVLNFGLKSIQTPYSLNFILGFLSR